MYKLTDSNKKHERSLRMFYGKFLLPGRSFLEEPLHYES